MKVIIGGKRYDTETATLVAQQSNDCHPNALQFVQEFLYLTGKGSWFLYGEGGALSRYSQPLDGNGNSRCGGKDLKPLTDSEALQWLEEHRKTNAIEEYFSELIEDA